ncbi:uncharacterized protein F4822DRAFT_414139 [Hypoxylon trugodes]|uniref:uncharacterized protein n=1 Tax=Hypoxylon trugodes TaxID=326681 RepID=UPI00219ACCDF|nr:uncharacterized protein F4822DRAFT_414139 [Hypoxylon trugodes]KAI1385779.1 hypothetical protein F4822DRAFT_414139 [Hypoxylon trugodes]
MFSLDTFHQKTAQRGDNKLSYIMADAPREDSPDTDQFQTILAATDLIRKEHKKENEEAEVLFKTEQNLLQSEIERLQQKMRGLEYMHKTSTREKKRLQDNELKSYFRMLFIEEKEDTQPPEPQSPLDLPKPSDVPKPSALESTRPAESEHQKDRAGDQIMDAITVHDSESDGSDIPLRERTNTPELSEFDIKPSPGQRKRQRPHVRITEPRRSGEHSDILPHRHKKPRHRKHTHPEVGSSSSTSGPRKRRKSKPFEGVINPTAGVVYKVQGSKRNGCAAVALPTSNFGVIGISRSMSDTGLERSIPECYQYDEQTREIVCWKEEYDDGGPRVTDREFPFMFFDELEYVPSGGNFAATGARFAWIPAKDIRPFDVDSMVSRMAAGYSQAKLFIQRLKWIIEEREEENRQTDLQMQDAQAFTAGGNQLDAQTPKASSTTRKSPDQFPRDIYEVPEELEPIASSSKQLPQSPWQSNHGRNNSRGNPNEPRSMAPFPTLQSIYQVTSGAGSGDDGSDDAGPYWSPSNPEHDQQINELLLEARRGKAKEVVDHDNTRHAGARGSPTPSASPFLNSLRGVRLGPFLPIRRTNAHTDTNDENQARSAGSSSNTQTLTHEAVQRDQPTHQTSNGASNGESTTALNSTASGALSYLNTHFKSMDHNCIERKEG